MKRSRESTRGRHRGPGGPWLVAAASAVWRAAPSERGGRGGGHARARRFTPAGAGVPKGLRDSATTTTGTVLVPCLGREAGARGSVPLPLSSPRVPGWWCTSSHRPATSLIANTTAIECLEGHHALARNESLRVRMPADKTRARPFAARRGSGEATRPCWAGCNHRDRTRSPEVPLLSRPASSTARRSFHLPRSRLLQLAEQSPARGLCDAQLRCPLVAGSAAAAAVLAPSSAALISARPLGWSSGPSRRCCLRARRSRGSSSHLPSRTRE